MPSNYCLHFKNPIMVEYQTPILNYLDIEVERGFGSSQGSPNFGIGIGGWESDEYDEII